MRQNKPDFTIRPVTPQDLPAVVRVRLDTQRIAYEGIFPQELLERNTYQKLEAQYRETLFEAPDPPGVFALLAEAEEKIVGMLIAGREKEGDPVYDSEIHTIYVLPAYQNRGIGKALSVEAARRLKEMGFSGLLVWVLEKNHSSRAFYAALGGKPVKTRLLEHAGFHLPVIAYGLADLNSLLIQTDSNQNSSIPFER